MVIYEDPSHKVSGTVWASQNAVRMMGGQQWKPFQHYAHFCSLGKALFSCPALIVQLRSVLLQGPPRTNLRSCSSVHYHACPPHVPLSQGVSLATQQTEVPNHVLGEVDTVMNLKQCRSRRCSLRRRRGSLRRYLGSNPCSSTYEMPSLWGNPPPSVNSGNKNRSTSWGCCEI